MPNWLENRHPDWDRNVHMWTFAGDHYDDREIYRNLKKYLPKKSQAEHGLEYEERRKLAQFENLVGPVLDSLVGLQFAKDDMAEREWGGLGDPGDPQSLAGQLAGDVDGRGTDLEAQEKQLAVDLEVYQRVGLLIDSTKPAGAQTTRQEARQRGYRPVRKLILPQAIVNWREDGQGRLVEALVEEVADLREDLKDPPKQAESVRYLHLREDGWARYVPKATDTPVEQGRYDYRDLSGRPILPLFVARLPIRRYPAYTLAKINNAVFNLSSQTFWQFRKAAFQYLVLSGDGFEAVVDKLKEGTSVLQERMGPEDSGGGHRFIGPQMQAATAALEYRAALLKVFWEAAQFAFSDQAVQRTATEISADFVASIGAHEATLAGALDEADTMSLFLLGQAAGMSPQEAAQASVRRTRDFTVQDNLAVAQRIKAVVWGDQGGVPALTPEIEAVAAERIARLMGLLEGQDAAGLTDSLLAEAQQRADQRRAFEDSLGAMAGAGG